MRLRDKVWTVFFLLTGTIFAATIAYEFLYVKNNFVKTEEARMSQVFSFYEKQIEKHLYKNAELVEDEYLLRGKPISKKLNQQKIFLLVESKGGSWRSIEKGEEPIRKRGKGYVLSESGKILGYVQEPGGVSFVFNLDVEELDGSPEWSYYKVEISSLKNGKKVTDKVYFGEDYVEKKYYIPVENGKLVVNIKREGTLYYSVMDKGKKIFFLGGGLIGFLTLLGARFFERSVSLPIARAAKKIDKVLLSEDFKGKISLGKIHELKELETGLNKMIKEFNNKNQRYKLLYDELPVFAAILDMDLNLIETNNYFKINLKRRGVAVEDSFLSYIPNDKINVFTSLYRKLEDEKKVLNEKFYIVDNTFNNRAVVLSMKRETLENGEEVILLTALDTETMEIQKGERSSGDKLDPLTNVYTEKYGHYYLEKYISMCKISNFDFLTIVVWPKNFKDTKSKYKGNLKMSFLKALAECIKSCLRGTDLIYKFDRNSFALLLPMAKRNEVNVILNRIKDLLEKNEGIYNFPERLEIDYIASEYNGVSSKTNYLKDIEKKMREKKSSGQGNIVIEESTILEALNNKEIKVYYEPILDVKSNCISLEAILRWDNPNVGVIYPEEFLPLAEETNILSEVTRYMFKEVYGDMEKIDLPISVNISASQLENGEFVGGIKRIFFERSRLNRLEIEIPEEALHDDDDRVMDKIVELREMGIGFTLDYFGSGRSSVHHIRNFKFNRLKIDSTFVKGIDKSFENIPVIESMIGMGAGLNITVAATGVGNLEEARKLVGMGCTHLQGEIIGGASSIEEVKEKVRTREYESLVGKLLI